MSKKYPAGIITKSPSTPTGPYQDGVASGVWTMEQMEYWMKQGLWPVAGSTNPGDPYYNYVTMLLNGDGTNGAQNNTFLDSSTNAFSITRNGNTTQGSFSPYGSNWSAAFDGAGDYVSIPYTSNLDFGTGDFTIEAFVFLTKQTQDWRVLASDGTNGYFFGGAVDGGYRTVGMGRHAVAWDVQSSGSNAWNVGEWFHVAYCRSGTTLRIFVNGVQQVSGTNSNSINLGSSAALIGFETGADYTFGNISNLRVVKGTALYTSNFTAPTTNLTAVSGTQLLTLQNNRFIDNSVNNFTLTNYGNCGITRFSPFNPTASYDTATIGGSGYFDGSGDYLRTNGSNLIVTTGDFCAEAWVYVKAYPASGDISGVIWLMDTNQTNNSGNCWQLLVDSSGYAVAAFIYGSTRSAVTSDATMKLNTWNHIAISRNGSNYAVCLNGVYKSSNFGSQTLNSQQYLHLGGAVGNGSAQYFFNGYISNARYVTGSAVYTANYTVPTSPVTAISGTQFLGDMTNASIPDYAMMNNLETVGNAQVSTSVKKFGTGSISFDGNGDRLVTQTNNTLFNLGSGDFTIEGWIYPTTLNFYHAIINNDAGTSSGTRGFSLSANSDGTVSFFYSTNGSSEAVLVTPSSLISTNNWYHIAVSRSSGTTKIFVNGTQQASGTVSNINFASAYPVMIGDNPQNTVPFYGYIDDLRITKGYARYTANFTPPTSAFYTY